MARDFAPETLERARETHSAEIREMGNKVEAVREGIVDEHVIQRRAEKDADGQQGPGEEEERGGDAVEEVLGG